MSFISRTIFGSSVVALAVVSHFPLEAKAQEIGKVGDQCYELYAHKMDVLSFGQGEGRALNFNYGAIFAGEIGSPRDEHYYDGLPWHKDNNPGAAESLSLKFKDYLFVFDAYWVPQLGTTLWHRGYLNGEEKTYDVENSGWEDSVEFAIVKTDFVNEGHPSYKYWGGYVANIDVQLSESAVECPAAPNITVEGNGSLNTLENVIAEEVQPVFDGGTLLVDANGVASGGETDINFKLENVQGNAIENNTDYTFSGDFAGDGGLIFKGSGVTTLSGNNTYKGPTVVESGTLKAGKENAFSASSAATVKRNATIDLGGKSQAINNLTVEAWGAKVKNGALVSRNLTNAGEINLTGLSQAQGSIINSGEINLGSGSLKATRLTNSGRLDIEGSAEVESLITSGNAKFVDLKANGSSANHSIENSGHLTIAGTLQADDSVLVRCSATPNCTNTTTITGVAGQASADVRGLLVGQESNQSGSSSFTLRNGNLDSDFIRIGSEKSSAPSSVTLNNGDVFSHSITIQSGSILDVGGTIDLFEQDHANGGSLELYGTAKAKVLQGSQGDDQVNLDAGSDLTLSGSTSTNLGQCSGGCDAAINLGPGNDLLVTNQAAVSIPSGSVIDGGDIGSVVDGEWDGEINVFLASEVPTDVELGQLKNFALVQWGVDGDKPNYLVPNGQICDAPLLVSEDRKCLLLTGERSSDGSGNVVIIDANDSATLRVGVGDLSFDPEPGSKVAGPGSNQYQLLNGNLSAVVLKGAGVGRGDAIELGQDANSKGHLSVDSLIGFDRLEQKAGDWGYDIKSTSASLNDVQSTPLDLLVRGGSVTIDVNPDVQNAGKSDKGEAWFKSIDASDAKELVSITNKGDLDVTAGILGHASLSTAEGATTQLLGSGSDYRGATTVDAGGELVAGSANALSKNSIHDVAGDLTLSGLDQTVKSLALRGGTVGEGVLTTIEGVMSTGGTVDAVLAGEKGLTIASGITFLNAENTFSGATKINRGRLIVTGSLSDQTAVSVGKHAVYSVLNSDEIGSIEGDGLIKLHKDVTLTAGGLEGDREFSGVISGSGGFTKTGGSQLTLSGANAYVGATTVANGFLALANANAIKSNSATFVKGNGRLDLATNSIDGGQFYIDELTITEGGQVFVRADQPLVSKNIVLDTNDRKSVQAGGIAVSLSSKAKAPIRVSELFGYQAGSLVVSAPATDEPDGTWKIIEGNVSDEEGLAANTILVVGDVEHPFAGLGEEVDGGALYKGYLTGGSLNLVIEKKMGDELLCELNGSDPDCKDPEPKPEPKPEVDTDGDGKPDITDPDDDGDGELDDLPGCEVGDDLCDIISDIDGDQDDASDQEEEIADEIIDGILDGLEDDEVDLPLIDYGQLATLVGSGLMPRNVDAAGRGVALHNNLLVDALFDRQPLRQFEELVAEEVVEESVVEEEVVEEAPVQPLWLKAEELSDEEATAYVEGAVEGVEVADAAVAEVAESEAVVVEFDGVSYADLQDDELDLAKRDGVSAWVKGFGGNSRADDSSILYNDYNLTAYGTSLGVDVALSESFQIGAYANYGDLNVHHNSGETGGGSWNPDGWGGGLTAQYSTRNFYVQGLLGASEFSGEQSRKIDTITSDLGGNTAKGDKTVTSYLGALRVGAPFKTGGVVLEPQGQVVWSQNDEHGFSENHGTEKNLRLKYKSRTTNFVETQLGLKLSVPIRTGERALLVPSLRAAWLADWDMGNEAQEIGYKFTNKTVDFDSELETQNGALIEAGLDYTIQNHNSTAWKIYGRGGVELWDSDRGATWRASGGVTFQF